MPSLIFWVVNLALHSQGDLMIRPCITTLGGNGEPSDFYVFRMVQGAVVLGPDKGQEERDFG
jgi:hypothetical protein